jgi:3-deoxy-D-manno-octulosonate 8-phosphate phosphatase (KDO 8-P phosphatase)
MVSGSYDRPNELEARLRASATKLVVTDVDGVLTDGTVYYSAEGEAMKRFSLRDGMGVERLRNDGVETAIVTREKSAIVARRAEKLGIRLCYLGVFDKKEALARILADAGLTDVAALAYIGDDVNDLGIMEAIGARGLTGAPADAVGEVLRDAHHICDKPGGAGAFRDFAEWILTLRADARTAPASGDVWLTNAATRGEGGA